MDDVDIQQQKEIDDLQTTDIKHWKQFADDERQRNILFTFMGLLFLWLFVLSAVVVLTLLKNYQMEVLIVPN